jgi:hypothetical protein
VIVQVFVPGSHTEHALSGHGLKLVADQFRGPWVTENRGQTLGQAVLFVDFPEQK